MRNSTLSRLALLGLASVSSMAFAASSMVGQIRFDANFTLNQDASNGSTVDDTLKNSDNLFVSRARLDFAGDVAKDWMYHVRLENDEHENEQLFGLSPYDISADASYDPFPVNGNIVTGLNAVIARAYVCWSGIEGINVMMGRIGTPEVTSDRLYYAPYIGAQYNNRPVGSVTNYSGDHPGFSVDGVAGPIGYSFGVWKQTDLRKLEPTQTELNTAYISAGNADFAAFSANSADVLDTWYDSKSLRLGFGGRLTFAQAMKNGASFGVGIGYNQAPLNTAVLGVVASQVSATAANQSYGADSYKDLSNVAVDLSGTFKAFQLNLGYQYQQMKKDTSYVNASAVSPDDATTYNFLDQKGTASAFWVELGYLVMGDSYKFCTKNAVVSGVKLKEKQAGFEVVARYGIENRKNMLALLSPVGWSDFNTLDNGTAAGQRAIAAIVSVSSNPVDTSMVVTIDNTGTTANIGQLDVPVGDDFFEEKMTGWNIGLNYYLAENAVIKIEYENRHNEFKRYGLQTSWTDSAFNKNVGTLRLRADYSF